MKGFVPTPQPTVDLMVAKLFGERAPQPDSALLDPGCGNGELIAGVVRYCSQREWALPAITGVELDPGRAERARERFRGCPEIEIREADFLSSAHGSFDYVIGNPPYVSILGLALEERQRYRRRFQVATGRFDLYALFFEQSLKLLKTSGRLVLITPEKFLYVKTAAPLREILNRHRVRELHFVDEATFEGLATYPIITTVDGGRPTADDLVRVRHRDDRMLDVRLGTHGSWLPLVEGFVAPNFERGFTLADVAIRISCGVATGADAEYLVRSDEIPADLQRFAYPTVSGRQIASNGELSIDSHLLAPYDENGRLLTERHLGALGDFLGEPRRRAALERRSCTAQKPWYAYHDSLPLGEMLRPKLLCKDITAEPFFVEDTEGILVPRHSVYYVVPRDPRMLSPLAAYLNSDGAVEWLRAHCQRAANGFLRMQSHVLKQLPVPEGLAADHRTEQQELLIA